MESINHHPLSPHPHRRLQGFSLLELMIVIALISALIALTIPTVRSVLESQHLTASGDRIAGMMERARVHSTTLQRVVAMRFYTGTFGSGENAVSGASAIQLLEVISTVDENGASVLEVTPLMTPFEIDSSLFLGPITSTAFTSMASGSAPFKGTNRDYREFYYFPNGTASLSTGTPNPYLTLSTLRDRQTLENPLVVSLDPITTRVTIFRP